MLPFQTFVQQAVHIGDQEITLKNTTYAQIMRSTDIFEDPKAMKSFSTSSSNGTTSSYEMTVGLDAALKRGALGYSIPGLIYSTSASGIYGFCNSPSYSSGNNCSWGPFNTLALCITTTNISSQITKDGSHVSLPALQAFLPNDQDPPSFQSGAHVYVAQGQNASTSMPPTSAADGTNLPSLAEIYYLYYDTCRDGSSSNAALSKSDATRWSAFQGSYQICMQTQSSTTSPTQFSDSTLLSSSTALNWYQTTKYNESAFCTKVEDEADDFCVAESVMQELSRQMGDVFNISAQFDRPDRSDIKYSSEWGPYLADAVLGAPCPDPVATRSRRSWGGGNPYDAPLARFKSSLDGIASSLSDA
ncbi:hypothetical protein K491DRAFT_241619 [Lophiostoma macrostomum CBS 122681]|uniref:Uncharacterized protein n=1 Tax=Lophiostoma macrostomum CBS 122681 TaxID=1314788 RepID=A0A6A6SKY8_9PLEO|nr:hypothetical protein K491DRAFT_241619 [Lophiostoma macrostomum CBS 122681]